MKLDKNILKLFLLLGMLGILNNCSHTGGVTKVDPCVEIPFLDAPEGACTNTVTHEAYLVPADEWKALRPKMIMIRASHWTKIKKDWLKGCRMLKRENKKCDAAVDSIDSAVRQLDQIIENIMKIKGE